MIQNRGNGRIEPFQSFLVQLNKESGSRYLQDVGRPLQNQHFCALNIDFYQRRPRNAFVADQSIKRHGFDSYSSAIPGKLMIRWMKGIYFEKHVARSSDRNSLDRADAF